MGASQLPTESNLRIGDLVNRLLGERESDKKNAGVEKKMWIRRLKVFEKS